MRNTVLSGLGRNEGVYFLNYKVIGLDGTEVFGQTFFSFHKIGSSYCKQT